MMAKWKLREAVAAEAARLVLRGKETDYGAARKRAARWLSRRKLGPDDLPTNAEIHQQIFALAGLFSEEQQTATLAAMREAALDVMQWLAAFGPRLTGPAVQGPVLAGAELEIVVRGEPDDVADALHTAGKHPRRVRPEDAASDVGGIEPQVRFEFTHRFPCVVLVENPDSVGQASNLPAGLAGQVENLPHEDPQLDRAALEQLVQDAPRSVDRLDEVESDEAADEDGYAPDVFPMLHLLLERLAGVRFHTARHPEGDALYHSLQVYVLGLEARPYDEEFLLACLLHDVGLGIDRRDPDRAAVEVLRGVLTERTCLLIARRRDARDYLKTGRIARSLRRSDDFDDLLLLAQCDLQGRVPGAQVPTLAEALDHIESLGGAWDDV